MNSMQKRKPAAHQKQVSHDVSSRRSAAKPVKAREEHSLAEPPEDVLFKVDIPKGLKDILVKSRALIKEKDKLLVLPKDWKTEIHASTVPERPKHAQETIQEFHDYYLDAANGKTLKQTVEDAKLIPVITRGIMHYFEKALATRLLYLEERGQFAFLDNYYRTGAGVDVEKTTVDEPIGEWYGADHLLRLLVILPEIVSKSSLDAYSIDLVAEYVQVFLHWLDSNKVRLFLTPNQYMDTPAHFKTDIRSRNH